MDIKKRIQELSLDQKAKLYFMGLVRQGKIDTLPEDPKAAYVSMMMDKDDYGRSISGKDKRTFVDPKDLMPAARAKKMAGIKEDSRDDVKTVKSSFTDVFKALGVQSDDVGPSEMRDLEQKLAATPEVWNKQLEVITKWFINIAKKAKVNIDEMKVTDKDGNDVTSDIIKKLEKSLEDAGYTIKKGYSSDADIRPGYKPRPKEEAKKEDDPREDPDYDMDQHYMDYDLPELAESLGYLTEEKYNGLPIRDNVIDYVSQILNQINDYENNVGPGEQMIDYNATRKASRDLMDAVDRDEEGMMEANTTGTGASFNAGSGEGYMTPKAFKKKRKDD